ncbi:inner centromere protein-like isoform X1 [Poecile atricapillus]|uniref:inner centromere protein-like isoform X1 n=1 Tax=Poecile atricapillus TaxID=48891 RepID=UPI002738E25D|nr:inner centromere protein-like isoform X1 [Poecile atricapillus]
MAEGPQQLLEVCGLRLSRFLCDAQNKHLAWLREVEEQGMRMLKSSFRDEPMLLPKTPSQRRKLRKRQSSWMREENKELSRRRFSRRRSGVKLLSSSLNSQRCLNQEQPQSPGCEGQDVSMPGCALESQAGITLQPPALPRKQPVKAHVLTADLDCQECPQGAAGGEAAPPAVLEEQLPEGDAAAELQEVPGVPGIPAEQPGRDGEQDPRRASTSTPKAARNGDPAALQGDGSPQDLEMLLFQDSPSKSATEKSRTRRRSGLAAPRKSHRSSLAEKCSLASRRENMIRRSISRAMARKAAARESSSASSRVSCQSSLEAFVEEDVISDTRPELEPNSLREKVPGDVLVPSTSPRAASPPAQHLSPLEQQAGNAAGSHVNPNSEPQKSQEQPNCAKSRENSSRMWMKGCKQALGVLWQGQHTGGRPLSPLDEKLKTSANQAPSSPSPASKVSGTTALCPLSQAGPELPPSLPSGCQATEELPAGTRGWHQGLHQAQHSHPAPPEGRLCCKYGTLSVGLTSLSPHADVHQHSGHTSGEVAGSLCRCVLLGLGTAGSFWPLSQAALCSPSTIFLTPGLSGHLVGVLFFSKYILGS